MKRLNIVWAWLSKHLKTIVLLFSVLSGLFFTFIHPVLLKVVCVPVWAVVLLMFMPLLLARVITFYYTKSNYKRGDMVRLKGNSTPYFVIGYGFLNKHIIKIRHYHHEAIYYHETFLEKL